MVKKRGKYLIITTSDGFSAFMSHHECDSDAATAGARLYSGSRKLRLVKVYSGKD